MIEDLPLVTPDASRSARTVATCHDRLAARRRRIEARNRRPKPGALRVDRVLVAVFCGAYLIAMAADLLAIAAQR